METLKSGFEWCLERQLVIKRVAKWPTNWAFFMDSYYDEQISKTEFELRLKDCETEIGFPIKHEMYLEYKMYGMVPYNLSSIQKGIQYGHAVVEYQMDSKGVPPHEKIYEKWAKKDKTSIILNGGTTNENPKRLGSIQKHTQMLKDNGIIVAEFREPDLNDTLTAVVFLVDERVFNRILYPDFVDSFIETPVTTGIRYESWITSIGGAKNAFLRSFLPNFKPA